MPRGKQIVSEVGVQFTGLVVDSVNEVFDMWESDVDSLPRAYAGMGCRYINGLTKTGRQIRIILNIKNIR